MLVLKIKLTNEHGEVATCTKPVADMDTAMHIADQYELGPYDCDCNRKIFMSLWRGNGVPLLPPGCDGTCTIKACITVRDANCNETIIYEEQLA